jgi:hypothetical protein
MLIHPHPWDLGTSVYGGGKAVLRGPLTPHPLQVTQCYFEGGYQETPVYLLGELGYGHQLQGPCLIIDSNRWAEAWHGWSPGWVNCWGLMWSSLAQGWGLRDLGSHHWGVFWPGDVGSLVGRGFWPGPLWLFCTCCPQHHPCGARLPGRGD